MGIRVELKNDLTRYEQGLVPGVKGYTMGSYGEWSRTSDRFVTVKFDNGLGVLDVLWDGLEIIDEEYLEERRVIEKKRMEALKTAKNIIKYVGPRGGFKSLCYEFKTSEGMECCASTEFRKDAKNIIEIFEKHGKVIIEKQF